MQENLFNMVLSNLCQNQMIPVNLLANFALH